MKIIINKSQCSKDEVGAKTANGPGTIIDWEISGPKIR